MAAEESAASSQPKRLISALSAMAKKRNISENGVIWQQYSKANNGGYILKMKI